MTSYEPFRGGSPPRPPPQSYEEFRATGKSIELTDASQRNMHTNNAHAGPPGYPGAYPLQDTRPVIFAPYNPAPPRRPDGRIPGKSFWATIRLILRFLSLTCSVITTILVGLVLVKYNQTKSQRNTEELFWPKSPKLQPTIYMLVAAGLTILAHIGLIVSHFLNRAYYYTEVLTKRDRISIWTQFMLCLVWIVGGFLAKMYTSDRYGNGNDLWSWTCEEPWHEKTVRVNFGALCGQLTAAYHVAYLNAFLEFLSLVTFSLNSCWARSYGYEGPAAYH